MTGEKFFSLCATMLLSAVLLAGPGKTWQDADGYTWTYTVSGNEVTIGDGSSGCVSPDPTGRVCIPSEVEGKAVVRIADRAFFRKTGISEVVFPDRLRKIGVYSFCGCTNIADVVIPDTVEIVSENAFIECCSITNFHLGASVTNYGHQSWSDFDFASGAYRISGLRTFTVSPENETYAAEDGVLYSHDRKALLEVPVYDDSGCFLVRRDVEIIAERAFYANAYTNVAFESGSMLTNIGASAFYYSQLKEMTLPDGLLSVEEQAFGICRELVEMEFPDSVIEVGDHLFVACSSLRSVVFGRSLRRIGVELFPYQVPIETVYFKGDAPVTVADDDSFSSQAIFGDYAPSNYPSCSVRVRAGSVGWMNSDPNSPLLPKLWPEDQVNARPIWYWNPPDETLPFSIASAHVGNRFPWSGELDLRYGIASCGGENAIRVWLLSQEYAITEVSGDGVGEGTGVGLHHVVWNLPKEYPDLAKDRMDFTLLVVEGKEGLACPLSVEDGVDAQRAQKKRVMVNAGVKITYASDWSDPESNLTRVSVELPGGGQDTLLEKEGHCEGSVEFSGFSGLGLYTFRHETDSVTNEATFLFCKDIREDAPAEDEHPFSDVWGSWSEEVPTEPVAPSCVSTWADLDVFAWRIRDAYVRSAAGFNFGQDARPVVISLGEIAASSSFWESLSADVETAYRYGVPTLRVRIREEKDSSGTPVLVATAGGVGVNVTVPGAGDPKLERCWVEQVYGPPPYWMTDAEKDKWYGERCRSRIEWHVTLVRQQDMETYLANQEADREAMLSEGVDDEIVTSRFVFGADGAHAVSYHSRGVRGVDVYGVESLTASNWAYRGTSMSGRPSSDVGFVSTNGTGFAKLAESSGDSDGDGILDTAESLSYGTNPRRRDTSGDGLSDRQKVNAGLDPRVRDTDGDGFDDDEEILAGTDPTVPNGPSSAGTGKTLRHYYDGDSRLIGTYLDVGGATRMELSPAGNVEQKVDRRTK